MSRVRDVAPKVRSIMELYPKTRSNDRLLIREVYTKCYSVNFWSSFGEVLGRDDLPSFESIRRARQRIQSLYPELRADAETEALREAEEAEYRNFAQEEVI